MRNIIALKKLYQSCDIIFKNKCDFFFWQVEIRKKKNLKFFLLIITIWNKHLIELSWNSLPHAMLMWFLSRFWKIIQTFFVESLLYSRSCIWQLGKTRFSVWKREMSIEYKTVYIFWITDRWPLHDRLCFKQIR